MLRVKLCLGEGSPLSTNCYRNVFVIDLKNERGRDDVDFVKIDWLLGVLFGCKAAA